MVASLLAVRGAVVVDADAIAHEVTAPGGAAYEAVIRRFGPGVLRADGTLDRSGLAAIVFANPGALADLNALTHPAVREAMLSRIAAEPAERVVVADIPLLAEGGRERWCLDGVVVVDAPVGVALERLVRSRSMDRAAALARIGAQASREQRLALADRVIDNSTDFSALEAQVASAWEWMVALGPKPS